MFVVVMALPASNGMPAIGCGKERNLTPDELALIERLDYGYAWAQLEELSARGEKTAGSEEELAAQIYVKEQLEGMPLLEVWMEEFRVANWDHYGTTVAIVSHEDEEIPATTYGDSPSIWGYDDYVLYEKGNIVADGCKKILEANVVDVGYGTVAEFEEAGQLDGAIALVHRNDNTQGWPNTPAAEADLYGASAVLFYGYFDGADNPDAIKQDSVFSEIPAISISPNSAARILELLAADEEVTLRIEGRVDFRTDRNSVNVAAVLDGTTRADEYVVISGHIDTWWSGSFDDCSSIAIMLEMARMFSEARDSGAYVNERTLVFCSVGSEESGGPDGTWFNWLVGSYEFVKANPEIMDGLVMELNIDGGSFPKTGGKVWLEISCEVSAFVWSAISDLSYLNVLNCYTPVWTWTDAWSFAGKGGGTAVEMVWGAGFDPYYHTQFDTIELQSEDMVAMVMELTALMAYRSVNSLVLPLDFVPACDWAAQYLSKEKPMVPEERANIDAALAALGEFEAQAVALNTKAAEIADMYSSAVSEGQKAAAIKKADKLNRAIIDARRIFIPWSMGEGGMMASWEPFLRPHQHATDYQAVSSAIASLEADQGSGGSRSFVSGACPEHGMGSVLQR